jgi:glycosyltransferase involved in cell wall biosynthesis
MKKTIVHFIHDLGRGGAETILVTTVRELSEYRNVVVTLTDSNEFGNEFVCDKNICLNIKHPFLFLFYALKFRKVLREEKADIVHARLFWPMLIARLGTPRSIPLVTTIHAYIATSLEYKKWFIRWLDKITYRAHKSFMMADSKGALEEYFSFLGLKPYKARSPYTFVDTKLFTALHQPSEKEDVIRLISVGRLSKQKNHKYLVEAFQQLTNEKFELHIYGRYHLYDELKEAIEKTGVKIVLKGQVNNINEIITGYDIFVMSSLYEGFSLAVLEAMALGMPLMLSDIASFREQCEDTAIYFDLNNPDDFVQKLRALATDRKKLAELSAATRKRVLENFTLQHHLKIVREVYEDVLNEW